MTITLLITCFNWRLNWSLEKAYEFILKIFIAADAYVCYKPISKLTVYSDF